MPLIDGSGSVAEELPALLGHLNAVCATLDGDARDRAHALAADAHHFAASLMLKHGDLGLAALAADRSMRAAIASGNPVAIASSARIITHALMNGGHHATAVATATSYASGLGRDLPDPAPGSLSVYGALLLRRAIAAAERKAALLIDTARAFLQRARHENAYLALRAACQSAPEEVTGRAGLLRSCGDQKPDRQSGSQPVQPPGRVQVESPRLDHRRPRHLQHDLQVGVRHERHLRARHPRRDDRHEHPHHRAPLRQRRPSQPRSGADPSKFPWHLALDEADRVARHGP